MQVRSYVEMAIRRTIIEILTLNFKKTSFGPSDLCIDDWN